MYHDILSRPLFNFEISLEAEKVYGWFMEDGDKAHC
jgi:hypothetical protein